jgi:hypothetical protein
MDQRVVTIQAIFDADFVNTDLITYDNSISGISPMSLIECFSNQ